MMWLSIQGGIGETLRTAAVYSYTFFRDLGGPGLLTLALLDSSFLSIPEGNDLLIVVLATGQSWSTMVYYVAMTVVGSVIGCTMLYLMGRRGGAFVQRKMSHVRLRKVREAYARWGSWAVLVPCILPPPTPFKIFVLSAGAFGLSLKSFILAVFVGRTIRYSLWGVLAVLYGEWAKQVLEQRAHLVALIMVALLIAGLVAYWAWKRRWARPAKRELT